jgi:hypothetical protein
MALPTPETMPMFIEALRKYLASPDAPPLHKVKAMCLMAEAGFTAKLRDVVAVPCDKAREQTD